MPGFSSHMISRVRANSALRKGRNNLFERTAPTKGYPKQLAAKPEAGSSVVKRLREKYREERRQERVYWLISFVVGLILLGVTLVYLG
jgi:hypothetical protein